MATLKYAAEIESRYSLSKALIEVLRTMPQSRHFQEPTADISSFVSSLLIYASTHRERNMASILYDYLARRYTERTLKSVLLVERVHSSGMALSQGLQRVMDDAQGVRKKTGGMNDKIGLRHMVFAILFPGNTVVLHELTLAGEPLGLKPSDFQEMQEVVFKFIDSDDEPNINKDAWVEIYRSRREGFARSLESPLESTPIADPPAEPIQLEAQEGAVGLEATQPEGVSAPLPGNEIAQFRSDDPWSPIVVDRTGADRDAEAIAMTVCSRQLTPPFAVGVFGNWGSGKSFFLRLLFQQIERLCRDRPELVDDAWPFHRQIAQIRFNAWHYAETNLWASLVDQIFSDLDKWVRANSAGNREESLLDKLSTARRLTLESAQELIDSRRLNRDAANELARAQKELEAAVAKAEASTDTIWAAVNNTLKQTLEREDVQKAYADLGLSQLASDAQTLEKTLATLKDEGQKSVLAKNAILRQLSSKCAIAILFVIILAGPICVAWVVETLKPGTGVGAAITGVVAVLSTAIGMANLVTQKGIETLQKLEGEFVAARDAATAAHRAALQAQIDKVERSKVAQAEAQARFEISSRDLAQATQNFANGSSRGRLMAFIRSRVANGDYAKHLGLIAAVRKDFDEVSRLVRSSESEQEKEATEKAKVEFADKIKLLLSAAKPEDLTDPERQQINALATPNTLEESNLSRIVLYIDDLDRCSPEKVIEVLEAVHLLLSFPVFVVFVAVDVRWLRQSLQVHYGKLLGENNEALPGPDRAATPSDYLEKIIQLPYWVRSVTNEAAQRMLRDQMGAAVVPPEPIPPAPIGTDSDQEISARAPASVMEEVASYAQIGAALEGEGPAEKPSVAQILGLSDKERDFIAELAPGVSWSPRRITRFVNTYKILKASLYPDTRVKLTETDHRGVLTLLAAATGGTDDLRKMRDWLLETRDGSIKDLITEINSRDVVTGRRGPSELVKCLKILERHPTDRDDMQSMRRHISLCLRYSFNMP